MLACAVLGVVLFAFGGVWAMIWPRSFFDQLATYPPYNHHLFHDLGGFQLGIAAALVAGIAARSGLAVGCGVARSAPARTRSPTGSTPSWAGVPLTFRP